MSGDNPQMKDFHSRLKRIDKSVRKASRAKGPKRMGVTDYNEEMRRKSRQKRMSWRMVFKTVFFIWLAVTGLKAFMATQMEPGEYEARIAELQNGSTGERIGSYILQRGPVIDMIENALSNYNEKAPQPVEEEAPSGDETTQPTEAVSE